jgi:hypothetical protein
MYDDDVVVIGGGCGRRRVRITLLGSRWWTL